MKMMCEAHTLSLSSCKDVLKDHTCTCQLGANFIPGWTLECISSMLFIFNFGQTGNPGVALSAQLWCWILFTHSSLIIFTSMFVCLGQMHRILCSLLINMHFILSSISEEAKSKFIFSLVKVLCCHYYGAQEIYCEHTVIWLCFAELERKMIAQCSFVSMHVKHVNMMLIRNFFLQSNGKRAVRERKNYFRRMQKYLSGSSGTV